MRILSDFDGVWTDQAAEAAGIQAWYVREAARIMGLEASDAQEEFGAFLEATLSAPDRHGWWPRGFLTAFVDEDELLATGAVSYWLDHHGEGEAAERWRTSIRCAGYETTEAFGNAHFEPAMRHHQAHGGHRLTDDANEVVETLRRRGDDLVIVSNSPTEKLESMFESAGIVDGVRFVGDARKWWIDENEPSISVAGRRIHVDRPRYRAILERERPDLVLGDVVSLDLALPAFMRSTGELPKNLQLWLREHPRASTWAKELVGESGAGVPVVDRVVPSIRALIE